MEDNKQPSVFISYSWDSIPHKANVQLLTDYFRKYGIDVELDKYQQGDELWDDWMQKCIEHCDYIFVICSEKYKQKFNGKPDKATGVYKEAVKIKNLLESSDNEAAEKIKTLFFGDIIKAHIPEELIRCNRVNCVDQKQLNDLYQEITHQKEKAPKLGSLVKELPAESPFNQGTIAMPRAITKQPEATATVIPQQDNDTKPSLFHVPYESKGEGAIGIEEKLKEVHKAMAESKKTTIGQGASFQGIGGLGKTQLAVEYAHRYRDQYDGVVWITVDQDINVQLVELAEKARWVAIEVDAQAKMAIAQKRYAALTNVLLIFDNVNNYKEIEPLFPSSPNHILLTSRNTIQGFSSVPLEILNNDNALKLLASESNREIKEDELEAAKQLVTQFDGLPLALEMAGAYVAHLDISWNDYLKLFNAQGLAFIDKADIRGATNHESNIRNTLSLSNELLEKTPKLKSIINLLAWGANEAIDKTLISKMLGVDAVALIEPISIALKLKIIKKEDDDGYILHRLVREVWRDQQPLKATFAEKTAQHLASYMKSIQDEFLQLRKLERAAIQAEQWIKQIDKPDLKAALLSSSAFPDFYMGKYQDALVYIDQALHLINGDKDSPLLADILTYKGSLTNALGDAKRAKPSYEQSLEMKQRLYPEQDHPDIATSLNNMGAVLEALDDAKAAKPFYKQSLEMNQRLYPEQDHPNIANSLNNMGTVLKALGDAKSAKPFYKQSLEMRQRLYPEQDHPDIASSLNNMGLVLEKLGDAKGATPFLKQSLEMNQRLYPEQDHPDIANSLNTMGFVLDALDDAKGAKPLYEQSLEMNQRLYPEQDHPDIAHSLSNIGLIYIDFKQCLKAQEYLESSLNMYQRLGLELARQQNLKVALKQVKRNIKMQKRAGSRKGRFCKDIS